MPCGSGWPRAGRCRAANAHAREGSEAHAELLHAAGARPVRDRLRDEAHRQHAVGEHAAHARRLRELVVLVDGVEVAGGAGVAGELDLLDGTLDERWQLVADVDVLRVDLRVFHSRTTVTARIVATSSLSRSVIAVSRTTKAIGPLLPLFS